MFVEKISDISIVENYYITQVHKNLTDNVSLFSCKNETNSLDNLLNIKFDNKRQELRIPIEIFEDKKEDHIEDLKYIGKMTLAGGGIGFVVGSIVSSPFTLCCTGIFAGILGSGTLVLQKKLKKQNELNELKDTFDKLSVNGKIEFLDMLNKDLNEYTNQPLDKHLQRVKQMYFERK